MAVVRATTSIQFSQVPPKQNLAISLFLRWFFSKNLKINRAVAQSEDLINMVSRCWSTRNHPSKPGKPVTHQVISHKVSHSHDPSPRSSAHTPRFFRRLAFLSEWWPWRHQKMQEGKEVSLWSRNMVSPIENFRLSMFCVIILFPRFARRWEKGF